MNSCLPGDLVLVRRTGFLSRLIALGQRLRFRGADRQFAHWTHVACVLDSDGSLVEALGRGVVRSHLDDYKQVEHRIVGCRATLADRMQMRAFLLACVGRPYGYVELVSLALTLSTGTKLAFGDPGTLICSALAAQMLCRGDYIFPRDPNRMMPADLAQAFGVQA